MKIYENSVKNSDGNSIICGFTSCDTTATLKAVKKS